MLCRAGGHCAPLRSAAGTDRGTPQADVGINFCGRMALYAHPLHTSIQPALLARSASSSQVSFTAEAALPAAG